MTRVRLSPLPLLLILGVFGLLEVVSVGVRGHPRFDEALGADRMGSEPVHRHLQEGLSAEAPTPTGEEGNPEENDGGGGDGPDASDNGGNNGGGIPVGDTDVEEEEP
ncbi:unnamed protein product [Ectocarpus sp. 8 AP-2014]